MLLCLGGVLEDDDPSLLFTELEAQVAHKLAPALGATHCTLTLVRRGAVKDRPSGLRLPTKAERPTKPPAEGELVLSRPLLNADNELLGVLEVRALCVCFFSGLACFLFFTAGLNKRHYALALVQVRVESSLGGGALRELEELVGMLALYLGALVTLLLELAGPDGETPHATRYSKVGVSLKSTCPLTSLAHLLGHIQVLTLLPASPCHGASGIGRPSGPHGPASPKRRPRGRPAAQV